MNKNLIITILCFAMIPLFGQGTLSETNKAKAIKKAKAEAAMFVKKGMSLVSSRSSMEEAITDFYLKVYTEESKNNPAYVWGMGRGKSTSATEAYEQALSDAKDHIPALLATYFNMWIIAAGDLSEEDKSKVQKAVNDASPVFTKIILNKEPILIVHLHGEKKGKYSTHVRVLYNQLEVREIARKEIKVLLKEETDWTDEKMSRILTFDH